MSQFISLTLLNFTSLIYNQGYFQIRRNKNSRRRLISSLLSLYKYKDNDLLKHR